MTLDSTFRHRDVIAKLRRVRTPDGAKYFDLPIGAPITADAILRAKQKHGTTVVDRVLGQQATAAPAKKAAAAKKAVAAAPKAAKKAAAKNDYDKRVDKFDRAINQAVRANDKKLVKQVHDLIGQDFILKKQDRDDLQAVLAARAAGQPDPAPVRGSNREARGVKGAVAAVPAKKVAAPKAPAKKAAEPRPAAKKATPARPAASTPPVNVGARPRAAKKMPAPPRKMAPAKPAAAGPIREAAGKTPELDLRRRRGAQTLSPNLGSASNARGFDIRRRTPADALGPKDTHGQKTNAWKRLIQRDIGNARTLNDFAAIGRQIDAMHARGRISMNEALALHEKANEALQARNRAQVKPKTKKTPRIMSLLRAHGNGTTTRDEKHLLQLILNAQTDADLRGVRREAARLNAQKWTTARKDRVNAAFKDKKRIIDNAEKDFGNLPTTTPGKKALADQHKMPTPHTIHPPSQPGAARARAKANLPSNWTERLKQVDREADLNRRLSALEDLMSALENDKEIDNADFNRIAEELNNRMDEVERDQIVLARIKGRFDDSIDPKNRAALDKHFATKKGTIGNAPTQDLYQYLVENPERFDVKRQESNKGISGIDIITDNVTGERWFAKHPEFANDYGKEWLAGDILNRLGWSKHKSRVSYGGAYQRAEGKWMKPYDGPVLITQDALQGNGLDGDLKRAGDMNDSEIAKSPEVRKGLEAGDPQGLVNMAVLDYFIDNTIDRHANNAFFQRKGGRMKVQFIDHGLAFGGVHAPDEDVTPSEWFRARYRANNRGGWNIARIIGQSTEGRDDVARRIAAAVADLKKLDINVLKAQYESNHGGNSEAMSQFDRMMALLEARLEFLQNRSNQDALVAAMAGAGGF